MSLRLPTGATFNWWRSTICAIRRNASSLSCLVSRTSIDAVRLLARPEKPSYAEVVASVPFSHSFSRESQVLGSTKDIGNVMKLLLTHLWYLSSWDAFHFSIMEPSFVGLEFACGAWMHVLSTRVLWMDKAAFRATTHVCIAHTSGCCNACSSSLLHSNAANCCPHGTYSLSHL